MASITALEKASTFVTAGLITNAETFTIAGKVYTCQDSLTNVDGNVKIGADDDATIANLAAAINLGAGAGTAYAALMTVNPNVSAEVTADPSGDILVLTAKVPGEIGNRLGVATTSDATVDNALLENGAGSIIVALQEVVSQAQVNSEVLQALQQKIINAPVGTA